MLRNWRAIPLHNQQAEVIGYFATRWTEGPRRGPLRRYRWLARCDARWRNFCEALGVPRPEARS